MSLNDKTSEVCKITDLITENTFQLQDDSLSLYSVPESV